MNYKTTKILTVFSLVALMAATAVATPRSGVSSGRHFLVAAEDLSAWHFGIYGRMKEYKVEYKGEKRDVEVGRVLAFAGYDLTPWATLYAMAGVNSAKDDLRDLSKNAFELGFGAWMNILDHDTFDFLTLEQRFRIQSALQVMMFRNDEFLWGELTGNITFGITHELVGSKFVLPDAITIYAGPAVNLVFSDDYDMSSSDMFGLAVGVDVQVNSRTNLNVGGEIYSDNSAFTASLSIRL